jgi:dipeptidyl aminopeptidase/acylaminoacyl peptidase
MRRSVGMIAVVAAMLVMSATARGTRHEAPAFALGASAGKPGTAPGTEHPPSRSALRWASQAPGTISRRAITDLDLLDFVWLADPQLSPDGRSVAVVRVTVDREHDTYASAIWEISTDGSFQPRALTAGPRDTSPRWSPNGTMLAFIRAPEDHGGQTDPPQVFALDRSGGDSRPLTRQPEGVAGFAWSPDSATLAVVSSVVPAPAPADPGRGKPSDVRIITRATFRADGAGYRDGARHTRIYLVAVRGGREPGAGRQLDGTRISELEPTYSVDGRTLFFRGRDVEEADFTPAKTLLYAVDAGGGTPRIVATIDGDATELSPSPDGRLIAFHGTANATPVQSYTQSDLFVVDVSTGAVRNLTRGDDTDIGGGLAGDQRAPRGGAPSRPAWTSDSAAVLTISAARGRANIIRVRVSDGAETTITKGDQEVQAFSASADARGLVALIATPTNVGALFVVDASAGSPGPQRITSVNDALFRTLDLPAPQSLVVRSFDGTSVDGWYVTPPGFDSTKKYPLILQIHGGPHAAYGYTFTHEFLAQAARGYVVAYVNPRGSTTYGQDFGNVIQFRYPGDDYKDLMAAVDAMVAKGFIDAGRLGVTGGSGGGLLTNWVIGHTDRFKAAVSQRSIADWEAWWYAADFTLFLPSWFHKAPWQDRADFMARSPITYADRIKTPLMLVDGDADYRTPPVAGGEAMFRALKLSHVPVVMIRVPNEGHELSRSGHPWHRIDRLRHIANWFDKWLQDRAHPEYDLR